MTKAFITIVVTLVLLSIVARFKPDYPTTVSRPTIARIATPLPEMVFFHCPDCVEEGVQINLFKTRDLNEVECRFPPDFRFAGKVVERAGPLVKVEFKLRCTGWISARLLRGPG